MRGSLRAGAAAVLACGLAAAGSPTGAAAAPACPVRVVPAAEAQLGSMIAAERRAKRVARVRQHLKLLRAGRSKSVAMASGGRFAHSASLPWAKNRAGGQNLAMATSAAQAFAGMLASPSHRRNMLAANWRFAAVGAARACDGMVFFTINFLGPPVR
jgi:uncharacterized protein YkwD